MNVVCSVYLVSIFFGQTKLANLHSFIDEISIKLPKLTLITNTNNTLLNFNAAFAKKLYIRMAMLKKNFARASATLLHVHGVRSCVFQRCRCISVCIKNTGHNDNDFPWGVFRKIEFFSFIRFKFMFLKLQFKSMFHVLYACSN